MQRGVCLITGTARLCSPWRQGWDGLRSADARLDLHLHWQCQDMGRTWVWPHDGAATQLGELLPSCPQTEGEAVLVERSPRAADPG